MPDVWYVSYGSNMAAVRLACYLQGGCPPNGARTYPGARDRRLPQRSIPVRLRGTVYFAGESRVWGGGMAFYDHDTPGDTAARGYLVTAEQFADIASQEMHRVPDVDHDLTTVMQTGRLSLGPGRYETILNVGETEGVPMLTFTAPGGKADAALRPPSASYLRMLAEGLREAHGWSDDQIDEYVARLVSVPGHVVDADHRPKG